MKKPLIGFIGQGWIGKNYSDNLESRGYSVVRYSQENPYVQNKHRIAECDITFIAVPTPTTPEGFDCSILEEVLGLIGSGKTAVIKSTVLPGTTRALQEKFPDINVLHSPEFLVEATAAHDAAFPNRNIIGYVTEAGERAAQEVMKVLPVAPFKAIIPIEEAEMVKYAGNVWLYMKVMFVNILYDACERAGINYEMVRNGMSYDPRIGFSHLDVFHKGGRGAGGHCFIKDFAAFRELLERVGKEGDRESLEVLKAMEALNIKLLTDSGKDLELLDGVYGDRSQQKN